MKHVAGRGSQAYAVAGCTQLPLNLGSGLAVSLSQEKSWGFSPLEGKNPKPTPWKGKQSTWERGPWGEECGQCGMGWVAL